MYCIRIRPLQAPLHSLDESSTRGIGQEAVQADISGVEALWSSVTVTVGSVMLAPSF
jgi:hypothetical protein